MEEETPSSDPPLDLGELRSRAKALAESRRTLHALDSVPEKLVEDLLLDIEERFRKIEEESSSIGALGDQDLEAYSESLKNELLATQKEDEDVSIGVESLTNSLNQDSVTLDATLDKLHSTLAFFDSNEKDDLQVLHLNGNQEFQRIPLYTSKDHNIEIMELEFLIEKHNIHLLSLMDLEQEHKRKSKIESFEDIFSGVKIIDLEKQSIRLLFQASIKVSDDVLHSQKLGSSVQPLDSTHEITINLINETKLKNVKIFPADVYLDEVVHIARSSRYSLCSLLRKILQRTVLSSLRLLVVKEVNSNSRHSITYSDKDETLTAHLVCGVDAYIKIPQGWPILILGLKLISIMDVNKKSITLSTLCKIKEIANSIDNLNRHQLAMFVDTIEEILVQEIQAEIRTSQSFLV